MAEPRDERVRAAYREMPDEGPSPALDAAIQAAARRAVGSRPGGARRWQVPVSIAAVLALAVGVSLQVERERPMVVDGTPVSSGNAEYPVSPPAPEAEAVTVPAKPAASSPEKATTGKIAPAAAEPSLRESAPSPTPQAVPEAKRFVSEPPRAEPPALAAKRDRLAAPATPAAPPAFAAPAAPAAFPAQGSGAASPAAPATMKPASPPAAAPPTSADAAERSRAAPQALGGMKSEAARDAATRENAMQGEPEEPEKRLARIADLRARGLHDEADRALAEFRRALPGYRISEAWLRKVER